MGMNGEKTDLGWARLKEQKRAISLLKAAFAAGRISHAYLFYGHKGGGKYQTAVAFTQLLFCKRPQEGEPCGSCPECQKIAAGNHPDVLVISPDGLSIKIEQIRALQERFYYQSYEGNYKVIIIRQADLLTEQAANSLLKVLEEPPEKTVFILLAEALFKLPITIQSRCQPVPFAYLDQGERTGQDEQSLALLTKLKAKCRLPELIAALQQGGYKELFAWTEMVDKIKWKDLSKKDLTALLLEQLMVIYRNRLIWQLTKREEFILGDDALTLGQLDPRVCLQALAEINKAVFALRYNANNRLNLEVLLLKLRRIEQREKEYK
ncbi:MAG TPA: DNA polymerase III subunit delta' [Clostridia bacterium]|nr:DNA polymerase III subunit delta' [Clostridia bacterium]